MTQRFPDDPQGIPGARAIAKGIVKAYVAGTHKADVQLVGSHPTLLSAIRVATDIPAADVVAGRQCTVLFLDPANQDDAVVLCIQGALPSGGGGITKHDQLQELLDDDHTQYALLAGRVGGQTLHGSPAAAGKLTLKGNSVDAAPSIQTYGYHEFTGVDDPDGSGQLGVGVLKAADIGFGTLGDMIYLIPPGPGQPAVYYKGLTFPQGFTARTRSAVYTPEATAPGQILTVQPINNNATGSGDAIFGQMFSGGTPAAQKLRGLRYEVGVNAGAGSIAELIACLTGLRNTLTGLPVTLAAYFRGDPFVWDAATTLTTILGVDLPEITRGVNRWAGGRARDCTANAGTYGYGWQVDDFGGGAVVNQWPFYYGAPLAANRGKFSVDRYGSIHTAGELATTIAVLTLVNGANNDVAVGTKSFVRVAGPTAAFSITGIAGGFDGKRLTIYNPTGNNMTLTNEDAASVAANRITTLTGANIVTTAAGIMDLIYSATDSRWILRSAQG